MQVNYWSMQLTLLLPVYPLCTLFFGLMIMRMFELWNYGVRLERMTRYRVVRFSRVTNRLLLQSLKPHWEVINRSCSRVFPLHDCLVVSQSIEHRIARWRFRFRDQVVCCVSHFISRWPVTTSASAALRIIYLSWQSWFDGENEQTERRNTWSL